MIEPHLGWKSLHQQLSSLESYFEPFRKNIVGHSQTFQSPYGEQHLVYADWIASGRLYAPIEEKLLKLFGPFVANTHTETNISGTSMTLAYHEAQQIIKRHVNARSTDVLITCGTGMTGAINKFQRILGLRVPCTLYPYLNLQPEKKPVVFITHMEHHSNQTSWLECLADVVILEADENGLVAPEHLRIALEDYKHRPYKIGAFTACSNVTGIETPYHELARIMHEFDGYCFVDFAMSAPYVDINMHPEDPLEKLDAIFFSPHKFLGGPGSSGVLIFDEIHYNLAVPDHPGGGTVTWTNPWGEHSYIENIEVREDGGTPGFLQTIRTALSVKLKEQMGVANLLAREEELVDIVFEELSKHPSIHILAENIQHRLGAISFYIDNIHYNLVVKLLNDRFGIQVRGGCSCAGTYGHYLLHIDPSTSRNLADTVNLGDQSVRPGWVRLSLHPTMTNQEVYTICEAIHSIATHGTKWQHDYNYNTKSNEFTHFNERKLLPKIQRWFDFTSETSPQAGRAVLEKVSLEEL